MRRKMWWVGCLGTAALAISQPTTGQGVASRRFENNVPQLISFAADRSKSPMTVFKSEPLTPEKSFTTGIEGPACDREGNIYAVNFARQGTIGKTRPDGKTEVFVELPGGSIGNGIRFDRAGAMYVADYTNHNVLRIDLKTRVVSVFAHEPRMSQPNDLAIGPDGTLYASDPNWGAGTGQIWKIDRQGAVTRVAGEMGTTNGIDLSPDGKRLYVNESVQRNVWVFDIEPNGSLTNKRLFVAFPDHGFDGMRADVAGNLYITRSGKGTIAKVSPKGKVVQEIGVLGARPSNICFGGPDGRTAYVTEVEHQRLVQFRVDRPGLEWQRWRDR
jgi:sugar lactone lactonase YvrE